MELAERLERDLVRRSGHCLEWTGSNIRGYGQFTLHGVHYKTHRLAWELAHEEPVPDGLFVLHACDNPPCCEPSHLFLGNAAQNSADMVSKGRHSNQNIGKTHCIHGHEFNEANTRILNRGRRGCKTCHIGYMARYYLRKKALE